MHMHIHRRRCTFGFTLIELLVVIAIIAILAAILFPVFAQAKMAAKKTVDLSNLKQLDLSVFMYGNDYDDAYPFCWGWGSGAGDWNTGVGVPWQGQTAPYVKSQPIWLSPVDNWNRGTDPAVGNGNYIIGCSVPGAQTKGVTYSMNYLDVWDGGYPYDGTAWWGPGSTQCDMSPTCDSATPGETSVPQVATTILIAPRPDNYHQWCQGWATDVFFNFSEFLCPNGNCTGTQLVTPGGGATMFNNGTNYALCDGHAKFMTLGASLAAQGVQSSTPVPSYWPTGNTAWPWPVGMWDKRQ